MFNERKPSTQLTSHQAWHEYGIPRQKEKKKAPIKGESVVALQISEKTSTCTVPTTCSACAVTKALGKRIDMQQGIYVLHESVL